MGDKYNYMCYTLSIHVDLSYEAQHCDKMWDVTSCRLQWAKEVSSAHVGWYLCGQSN